MIAEHRNEPFLLSKPDPLRAIMTLQVKHASNNKTFLFVVDEYAPKDISICRKLGIVPFLVAQCTPPGQKFAFNTLQTIDITVDTRR